VKIKLFDRVYETSIKIKLFISLSHFLFNSNMKKI